MTPLNSPAPPLISFMSLPTDTDAGRANLSLRVTAEEPIHGLRATPVPEARVLQGALVRYSPVVEAGSDVVFRWTIDDKQSLTFHNVVFNVIYQSAAIFKLSRWAARTFSNKTLVLDETTTSTGSSDMRLVLRRGVLRDGEGYTFTLTVLGHSGEEQGCASIRLSPNRPPLGGACRLFPLDAVRALITKVHFECVGTTAHVGIMLYGADSRSGHRHLDGDRAFHRNSLDIFRIATPHSLGNVWKIRVWHDNKGLSPAWFLQHIIVRDLQSARSTFFLVNDWLSVETEANGGLVEKEVLAASDAALWQFQRLLVAELQRGFFDKHIWLSLWDQPARSRFTRVQRATCCVLLICLFLGANAVWYGVVGDATYSVGPVSHLIPPSVDTVATGLVSSVVVYPVYLAVLFLFRMSRSKVAGGPNPSPTRQRALELDSCLDSSLLDSSFLTFSGLRTEAPCPATSRTLLGRNPDQASPPFPRLPRVLIFLGVQLNTFVCSPFLQLEKCRCLHERARSGHAGRRCPDSDWDSGLNCARRGPVRFYSLL
ncbi:polycystin-1-like [Fukomys damarensis]|uniref:polycystin-1-like n=1 Tax=Fukomys damarensis TaxID=885580 RepID=UPI001455150B|nr:polycystin-1-like [Fukomys damarensis]